MYRKRPYDDNVIRGGHTKSPKQMHQWMLRNAISEGLRPCMDDMDAEERESLEADVERLTKAARLAEVDAVGLLDKVKKSMPPAGGSMDAGDDEL